MEKGCPWRVLKSVTKSLVKTFTSNFLNERSVDRSVAAILSTGPREGANRGAQETRLDGIRRAPNLPVYGLGTELHDLPVVGIDLEADKILGAGFFLSPFPLDQSQIPGVRAAAGTPATIRETR